MVGVLFSGASSWVVREVRHPSGPGNCRRNSKIPTFVGKYKIVVGVKEASIFMPILPIIRQLRELLIFHNIENTVHSFSYENVVNRVL